MQRKKQRFCLNDKNSGALQTSLFDDGWEHCIRSQSSQLEEYLHKTVSSHQLVLGTSISLTSRAVASSFSLATLPAEATTVVTAECMRAIRQDESHESATRALAKNCNGTSLRL